MNKYLEVLRSRAAYSGRLFPPHYTIIASILAFKLLPTTQPTLRQAAMRYTHPFSFPFTKKCIGVKVVVVKRF